MQFIFMADTRTDTSYTGTEGQMYWICYVDIWMRYTVADGTRGLVILGHRVKLTNSGTEETSGLVIKGQRA